MQLLQIVNQILINLNNFNTLLDKEILKGENIIAITK